MTTTPQTYAWTRCPDPTLQVNSVSISDDGSRCVFGTSNEFNSGSFATYFCDGDGNLLWSAPVSKDPTYQGIFWTAVSGDGNYVAAGGENTKTDGFLFAYEGASGKSLLGASGLALGSRVNQVTLSQDGKYMAFCYGSNVAVYMLSSDGSAYTALSTISLAPYNINSCEISSNGACVVASGIQYIDNADGSTTTQGKVFSYSVDGTTVTSTGDCALPTGSMRVAVSDNGRFWAASLHDGSCVLINGLSPTTYQWQYSPTAPTGYTLSLAYAVDVTETDLGLVYVACGANIHQGTTNAGLLYLVRSEYDKDFHGGVQQWAAQIERSVNPGVTLDRNATYVTATDGQPISHSTQETPGSFYLFDTASGTPVWKQDTSLMNWPMMLAADGKSAFGGSDNGSVFYWKL